MLEKEDPLLNGKWWQEQLRIADIILPPPDELERFDAEKFAKELKNLNFNCQHLGVSALHYGKGGEDTLYYFKTDNAKYVRRDFLNEYIPYAKKYGISVIVYVNVHWFGEEFTSQHLDWMQKDKDGLVIVPNYGVAGNPCVNSPFRNWSFKLIRDISVYDIGGIFLDGPFFDYNGCYCTYCQEKFKELYNGSIPEVENKSDSLWRRFIEFRSDSITEYLKDARKVLKSKRPNAIIYMNSDGLSAPRNYGRDNRKLIEYQYLLGAEGGFLFDDLRKVHLFKPGATAKLLETQANGKPTVVFIAGRHMPWTRYLLTESETKILLAQTIANGANFWYGIYIKNMNEPSVKAVGEINEFLSKNSMYFKNTKSMANVALLWSGSTANYFSTSPEVTDFGISKSSTSDNPGNIIKSFRGYYDALVRTHILFDVIDEFALGQDILSKYEVLILPNCACLSKEDIKHIKRYVYKGGNLIATFNTSLSNENGQRKKDFQLSELFGVSYEKNIRDASFHNYIILKDKEGFFGGLLKPLLPAPKYSIKVKEVTASPLAYFLPPTVTRYSDLSEEVMHPSILINKYGKGKCLYFSGTFDEQYEEYQFVDYLFLLGNAAKKLSHQIISMENTPSSVEVVLREAKDRILIHLINFTGEMTRPIKNIIPISNIKITINKELNVRRVIALMSRETLNSQTSGTTTVINLPVLHEYEVISVEKANEK